MNIFNMLRNFYQRLLSYGKLSEELARVKAELKLVKRERTILARTLAENNVELERIIDQIRELEDALKPPAPPTELQSINRMPAEMSLREVFGNCLIYGLDDNVNDVPLLSDLLKFVEQAGVYNMVWTPDRTDCDNFTRGLKGLLALAPGWGGIIALDLQFERPLPPFGAEYHSEFLTLAIEDGIMRWFVIEGQEKEIYEIASEMFAPDTGNRVTLIK